MRSGVRPRRGSARLASLLVLCAAAAGCIADVDEGARSPRAGHPLPSRLRLAVCEAIVAAAQNGVRPSALEVELPVDGTRASVALRFEGAQLPEARQCADLFPAAAMLPALPPRAATLEAAPMSTAPARLAPSPPVGALEPYIPPYPARTNDPLNTRR